ncbi:MAG: exodeoxyribonuclease VII large subunit [Thermoanaerobaculia bacterium]
MATRHVYQVSDLLTEINDVLSSYFDISVEGEVTNFTRASSGHLYFSIKDAKAQLSVVMFATSARGLKFRIENGLKLILRGRLKIYEPRGTFQFMADSAEPAGLGALQLAFEQLKAKLQAEGLFDPSRKKPIPALPQRIAVITSPTGAAVRDIVNVLTRRFDGLSIQMYPVRVQGTAAAREIANALRDLSRWDIHDVVLICRGGGSLEDLWPFNEEIVARAVAACRIPTISGVGHEVDFTICDFVADLRAPTPSAAAEIVIRAKADLCTQIDHSVVRIRRVFEGRVERFRTSLRHFASSDGLGRVPARVAGRRERLQNRRVLLYRLLEGEARALRQRLTRTETPLKSFPARLALRNRLNYVAALRQRIARAERVRLERHRRQLESTMGTLQAVSPLSVVARGYAIAFAIRNGRRQLLIDSMSVAIGDPIELQLKKGSLSTTVDGHTLGLETLWPETKAEMPAAEPVAKDDAGSSGETTSEEITDGAPARQ